MFWFAPMLCLENHESVSGGEAMFHTPQLVGISHFFSGRRIAKFGALAVLAQLIAGSIARGQATTSIRGTVTDSSGGYVGGASVTLTNPESKIARTATTGDEGGYQFLFLPPGTYTLDVDRGRCLAPRDAPSNQLGEHNQSPELCDTPPRRKMGNARQLWCVEHSLSSTHGFMIFQA